MERIACVLLALGVSFLLLCAAAATDRTVTREYRYVTDVYRKDGEWVVADREGDFWTVPHALRRGDCFTVVHHENWLGRRYETATP